MEYAVKSRSDHRTPEPFGSLLVGLGNACRKFYGKKLVSLAVFGSVGRGTPKPDSDIDILIVVRDLPDGRLARMDEFRILEKNLRKKLDRAEKYGVNTDWSPVLKTPEEIKVGSPLLLDMVEDARILYDRDQFLKSALADLKGRLEKLGSKRIWDGSAWYWDLKPDFKPGDVFEI